MRRTDVYCGLTTLVFGSALSWEAQRITDPGHDIIGPGAFPFLLGVVIAACGVMLLVGALFAPETPGEPAMRGRWLILSAALVLLVAYAQSLAWLGFLLATFLFVPACLGLLGVRSPVRLAFASAGISVSFFVLFRLLLGIDLPLGRLWAT